MISLTNLHCVQEIALCRRGISDRRGKTGAGAVAYTPAGFPHASHDVRQTPLPDETWAAHTPLPARGSSHPCSGVCSRRNSLHSVPVNRQTPRDAFFQKNILSACVRRTDRKAVFFCRGSGMFHRTPLAVFSLELVAYLERAAYAFPRPRIAGGAKQEGDRNLF